LAITFCKASYQNIPIKTPNQLFPFLRGKQLIASKRNTETNLFRLSTGLSGHMTIIQKFRRKSGKITLA